MQDPGIFDENELDAAATELILGDEESQGAEVLAMHTDNTTAEQASDATMLTEMVPHIDVDNEEEPAHKGRQSTSEKAKAAKTKSRQSTSEKALIAEEEKSAATDPNRARSKKYRAVVGLVDRTQTYALAEAVALVKQLSTTTFDAAIELHALVKGENIRGTVVLPGGSAKTRRVAIADEATLEAIAAGTLDFDVLLATPAQMPKLAKHAKVLGPKGLMPSPKAGTVTEDLAATQAEITGGRVEYRADKGGVVHLAVGRVSFTNEQLEQNVQAVLQTLLTAKVQSVVLAPTMGPSVRLTLTK